MKRIALFFLVLILFSTIYAQTGNVAGRVVNGKTGEYLGNASVMIAETNQGMYTNEKGSFIFKDIPVGPCTVVVSQIGFKTEKIEVTVEENYTETIRVELQVQAYAIDGIRVNATRAIERETPVAFTTLDEEAISDKYTTEDIPLLLEDVPGLFSSSSGLGESDVSIRGFDAEKIQILINGIPVNDPESQQVYWSNWTGLSSNVKSVQVQRGAGSSMYGSGAFGGSINIETMGLNPKREITVRSSVGGYESGHVSNARGGKEDYHPYNYNVLTRFNSGAILGSKFNYSLMLERKGGDSYINGTYYDGWSFGAEAITAFDNHSINLSFIGAPQKHNQARAISDPELWDKLGRNYNRNNHYSQENYYFKPQVSLRWDWTPDEFQQVRTNVFVTKGQGGGRYLAQDTFNTETGEIGYVELEESIDYRIYRRHAMWTYLETGQQLDGFEVLEEDDEYLTYIFNGVERREKKDRASNAVGEYEHSRINDSHNEHFQYGTNLYYDWQLGSKLSSNAETWLNRIVPDFTFGGEYRVWEARHYAETEEWRSWDPNAPDTLSATQALIFDEVERRYDYDSRVVNTSAFARLKVKPVDNINIVGDIQYANYYSQVEENPIEIFNFGTGEFSGIEYYATKDIVEEDDDGNEALKFSDDDYDRNFSFWSPKVGINVNLTDEINIMASKAIAYKEPKVSDWYNRSSGPIDYDLKPEKAETWEVGTGFHVPYEDLDFDLNVNYYRTYYTDKIERVTDQEGNSITKNAGNAIHSGWEISYDVLYRGLDYGGSITIARNRWSNMSEQQIFDAPSERVIGRVVPYSPEKMANFYGGYTFRFEDQSNLRIGYTLNWWDEYYASYTNYYTDVNNENQLAKLPYFLSLNANIKYSFKIWGNSANVRLDLNNLNNREENCESASYSSDYGRDDMLYSKKYMYVVPAAMFNAFLTMEYKF